ncbi:MAG: exodeoxyribonuclease VII large subunit [Pseudomonadota bacterium]
MDFDDSPNPLTVSQLNREAKRLLESGIGRLWVEGEVSNLARPASGHVYFRLKDSRAQVASAWFRQRQRGPTIGLKNGDQVLAYGQISLYEARGDFQLIVEQVEPAGEGILKRQYEKLRNKLAEEGLFDEDRKRTLPRLPTRVGVVTSPSGAAIRDILTVMARRFPSVPVVVYPAAVQGEAAAPDLITAIETANRRSECDVLIVGRGGGALEDLWGFNDEALARCIAASEIPVVSAVGHEVDFTIADFVADVRAPTPSGAAELVVPDRREWIQRLDTDLRRLTRSQQRLLENREQLLDHLQRRLLAANPARKLEQQRVLLRELTGRLQSRIRALSMQQRQRWSSLDARLKQQSPAIRVQASSAQLRMLLTRLRQATQNLLSDRQHRLALSARALHSVSPLATLQRGYAIVLDENSGKALTEASAVRIGDPIEARLANGSLKARVETIDDGESPS